MLNVRIRILLRNVFVLMVIGLQNLFAQNTFSGRVTDEKQEAIVGAQIVLLKNDSIYAADLTDEKGRFKISNIVSDTYHLRVYYVGYTPIEEDRQFNGNSKFEFSLMKEMVGTMDEVEVVAKRSDVVKRTATGQIFYPSEKGKNSGDPFLVLKEIPRLRVNDALRDVKMADGSNVMILVNGMVVNSGVAPIDPKDIESVEVIDVVNARYLRTGIRHIINIKTKKQRNPYRYFEIMTRHDVPIRQGMGALYFEVGNAKSSLFGRFANGYIYDDDSKTDLWQHGDKYTKQSISNGRNDQHNFIEELLFKWMLSEKDYLAVHTYAYQNRNKSKSDGSGNYQSVDGQNLFNYMTHNYDNSWIWTESFYYKHLYSKEKILELTMAYNYNKNHNDGNRRETYPEWMYLHEYEYRNRRSSLNVNLDYSWNMSEVTSLNFGSETKYLNDRINQINEKCPIFHHCELNQYVYAAFSSVVSKLNYMLSLGVESICLKAAGINGNYIKPRASVSTTYNFNDHHSFQVSYTLTNEAPNVAKLNPYNTSTDSLVIVKGNPNLFPMQQHNFNSSYTFNIAGLYISPNVDYNIYTDIIEPFGYSENGIYFSTYHNNGRYRTLSTGGSVSYRLKDWGQISISGSRDFDYFSGQNVKKHYSYGLDFSAKSKKWTYFLFYNFQNKSYTAVSYSKYYKPNYSLAQIKYNITPNFYVSFAVQYFTGLVHSKIILQDDRYMSITNQKMKDLNIRPWILIRYTFRKNDKAKIKLNNVVTSKEKGISL